MAEFMGTKRQIEPTFTTPASRNEPFKNTAGATNTMRTTEPTERHSMSARKDSNPEQIRERIEQRAYEIYEQRGREGGRELDDWLRAEQEVRSETIGSAD